LSDNVYIQSNEPEGNRVLAFRRDPDGTLTQRGTFSTGGAGTGTPHLQSQGSVVLTGDGRGAARPGALPSTVVWSMS
jgi:hypothetical protein